jgi:hypothetical protein
MDGGVLAIDPDYFDISGGLSRWLYRVARKHAGGNGAQGFTISMPTLYEKSGSNPLSPLQVRDPEAGARKCPARLWARSDPPRRPRTLAADDPPRATGARRRGRPGSLSCPCPFWPPQTCRLLPAGPTSTGPDRVAFPDPAISATPPSGHSRGPTCRTPSAIWALSGPTSGTSSPSARSRPMRSTSNRSSPPSAPARPPRVEKAAHAAFLKPRVQSRVAPNRMLFVFLKPRAIEHRQSPAMAARQQRMSGAASLRKTHQPVPNAPEIGQSHPRKPPISHTSAPGLPARTNRAAQPSRPPCPLPLLAEGHRTERAKSRIRVFRNAGTGFQERRSRGFRNGLSGFGEHRTRANRRISAESRCLSTRANSLIRT